MSEIIIDRNTWEKGEGWETKGNELGNKEVIAGEKTLVSLRNSGEVDGCWGKCHGAQKSQKRREKYNLVGFTYTAGLK